METGKQSGTGFSLACCRLKDRAVFINLTMFVCFLKVVFQVS